MALNFEKFAQEGNLFVKNLAKSLGHPDETGRTGIILRAVLHTIRDRITISESLNMLSQLPMFIKAVYADSWKYREKPLSMRTVEDFTNEVEKHQQQYGEYEFNWKESTEDIVKTVIKELGTYITKGEFEDIMAQLPEELEKMFRESIPH